MIILGTVNIVSLIFSLVALVSRLNCSLFFGISVIGSLVCRPLSTIYWRITVAPPSVAVVVVVFHGYGCCLWCEQLNLETPLPALKPPSVPCICRNPSAGSLAVSESGSLDRLKSAGLERRKKVPGGEDSGKPTVSGRVEGTRVDADSLIDEILKNKKLDQVEESAESE